MELRRVHLFGKRHFGNQPFARCAGGLSQALVEITRTNLVWTGSNVDERLRQAYISFQEMCKLHGIRPMVAPCLCLCCQLIRLAMNAQLS